MGISPREAARLAWYWIDDDPPLAQIYERIWLQGERFQEIPGYRRYRMPKPKMSAIRAAYRRKQRGWR